ncbi:MAG: Mur ligase family protein, partial [Methanobacteriaceae archaeon]
MNTLEIANAISAKLIGPTNEFTGIFTVLGESKSGDIVTRHWINEKAIEIAKEKDLAGIITSDPRGRSCELAEE